MQGIKKIHQKIGSILFASIIIALLSYVFHTILAINQGFDPCANPRFFITSYNFGRIASNVVTLAYLLMFSASLGSVVVGIIQLLVIEKLYKKATRGRQLIKRGFIGILFTFLAYFLLNIIVGFQGICISTHMGIPEL